MAQYELPAVIGYAGVSLVKPGVFIELASRVDVQKEIWFLLLGEVRRSTLSTIETRLDNIAKVYVDRGKSDWIIVFPLMNSAEIVPLLQNKLGLEAEYTDEIIEFVDAAQLAQSVRTLLASRLQLDTSVVATLRLYILKAGTGPLLLKRGYVEHSARRTILTDTCDTIVVTCIDFRFQSMFERWAQDNLGYGHYDRVAVDGGVKDWETVLRQIEVSKRLHQIRRVILINHEDCGAYGKDGSKERQVEDLRRAKQVLLEQIPELQVELYFANLNGALDWFE